MRPWRSQVVRNARGEHEASAGRVLLFEECTRARMDALLATLQGQHRSEAGHYNFGPMT